MDLGPGGPRSARRASARAAEGVASPATVLELGKSGLLFSQGGDKTEGIAGADGDSDAALRKRLAVPNDRRMWDVFRALDKGWTAEQVREVTKMDPWFLRQFADIVAMRQAAQKAGLNGVTAEQFRTLKRAGFGDQELALAFDTTEAAVAESQLYFTELLRRNLPARIVVDSDFTFLNERLAQHYGVPGVSGISMRRVDLPPDSPRGYALALSIRLTLPSKASAFSLRP